MIPVGRHSTSDSPSTRRLGQGGMGTVYRATDKLLGRNVAIKLLKDSGTEEDAHRIRLEAQILARLLHDKIVRLYDFGESEGHYFLVMEEVNGPSFASRWRDLLLEDRLRICGQVAEALHYAHLQGVIHRDVKPGNVLLTPNDEAKLSDFGLSLLTGGLSDQSGTIRGTPLYMSPEQVAGQAARSSHRHLFRGGDALRMRDWRCSVRWLPDVRPGPAHQLHSDPSRFKNPRDLVHSGATDPLSPGKNPGRRPGSGSVVALGLLEEAELARRLERINPGSRRSDPRSPAAPTPSVTSSVSGPNAGVTPANGNGKAPEASVAAASMAPSARFPPCRRFRFPPLLAEDLLNSSRTCRPTPGSSEHVITREMLTGVLATPIMITPRRALPLRPLPGVPSGRLARAWRSPSSDS